MFLKKIEIKGVNRCFCSDRNTVIISESKNSIWLNDKIVFQGNGYLFATIVDTDFFVFGNSETIFSGKISSNSFKLTSSKGVSWGTYSEQGVVIYKNEILDEETINFKKDSYYRYFETGIEKSLFMQEFGGFIFSFDNNTKLLFKNLNILKSLSLTTVNYDWEIDLGKYSSEKETVKIKELLGIWQENLVVVMDNNDILVLISLKTGQITAEIKQIHAQLPKHGPWGFGWHFHLEGDFVYLLQQNRYLRIDLATQQIETLWIPENSDFNIQRVSYDTQYAYFMACDGYHVYTDILVVFDRKALKIMWQHDQPIYSSQPPQSDGKKLYCLDNEGTLHIFERDTAGVHF